MTVATSSWPHLETDPQRQGILTAADRLLAGTPRHSTGNLSVVQLAIEAQVKYWVVAQKHPDLRDHFQQLAAQACRDQLGSRNTPDKSDKLTEENAQLRLHCTNLEELLTLYATAINELALENQTLRQQASHPGATVLPLDRRGREQP